MQRQGRWTFASSRASAGPTAAAADNLGSGPGAEGLSIPDQYAKARALTEVTKPIAVIDPDRAAKLIVLVQS